MSAHDFVHLHTHSHYSLLEALPKIPDLVAAAARDGQMALALTDNGTLYGAIEFYTECKQNALKPIIGVDFFLEITRHPEIDGHEKEMQGLISLGREANIPLVAAHDTSYLKKEDALARELVRKIRSADVLNRDFAQGAPDFSFIPRERMRELFADIPEALENSGRIADRCNLELKLGTWVFPDFPIPQ